MQLKQIFELVIKHDQIYLLTAIQDKIIINDAYNGIVILNDSLSPLKEIELSRQKLEVSSIFKKETGDALLFYSEKDNVFIYLDVHTLASKLILAPEVIKASALLPLYYWNQNELVVTTPNAFYQISIMDFAVNQISAEIIEEHYFEFFKVWAHYKDKYIISYDPIDYTVIFEDKGTLSVEHYDIFRKRRLKFELPNTYDKIFYFKGLLLLVTSTMLFVIDMHQDLKAKINVQEPYFIKSACFISLKKIAALWVDKADSKRSLLKVYELS